MLLTPDFESVVEWRKLQESKLRALNPDYGMKAGELRAFMEYFQRLTEFMRTEMPQRADVVLAVAENHQVESMVPNLQSVKYSRGEEL
jgi:D-glycerate 3-kinase